MKNEEQLVLEADLTDSSDAGQTLSALGAAKGGEARAKKLSPERRREIARAAVEARWAKAGKEPVPVATHGSPDRPLKIANIELQAYVLSDGTRVLSQAGFLEALGRHRKANVRRKWAEEQIPPILQGKAINEFISKEILEKSRPIKFRTPRGLVASGYRADLLPDVCEIYLKAREAGKLPSNQSHVATQAEILIRGLANVGIIALVDEATGYQDDRAKDALAKILEKFIAKELRPYVRTFPTDFYKEMFRLRTWKWPELPADQRKRPILVGNLTDNVVYDRLAPGVKQKLKELIGRDDSGRLKKKMFQRLTEEIGDPKLKEHLASVVALMKAADTWPQFITMIDRALPRYKPLPLFDKRELEA
ncbi:MAG: P63C domain-containing protein [Nitrososphaerales archaeon]